MMKKIIFALFVLVACSKDPEPVYTSLAGDWVISGEISGRFTLAQSGADFVVDHGYYNIGKTRYDIGTKRAVERNSNFQITIFLIADQKNSCDLRFCDYDLVKFKTISPKNTDCYVNGTIYNYTNVKVTR